MPKDRQIIKDRQLVEELSRVRNCTLLLQGEISSVSVLVREIVQPPANAKNIDVVLADMFRRAGLLEEEIGRLLKRIERRILAALTVEKADGGGG